MYSYNNHDYQKRDRRGRMENSNHVNISGVGKLNGGQYSNIEISGFGRLTGDVQAQHIHISGSGTIDGDTKAERIRVTGAGTIYGNVEATFVESTGNFKVTGQAEIKELVNEGRCRLDTDVNADKIHSSGYFSIGGNIRTENFYSKGSLTIEGRLEAQLAEIEITGFCNVRDIVGKAIYIRKQDKINLSSLSKFINPLLGKGRELDKLKCQEICGQEIDIEFTEAKVIKGNKVTLGPDCRIEEVIYKEELKVHSSAWVGKEVKG